MAAKSRAEYFQKRRETIGQFSVPVPREKLEALTKKLGKDGKTKTEWLLQLIENELRSENENCAK